MAPLILSLMFACGPKQPAATISPEPQATVPAVVEDVVEVPVEEAPAAEVLNADLTVKIEHADGTVQAGHVKRIERSDDWFGETGWLNDAAHIGISAESDVGTQRNVTWSELRSITIKPGKIPDDVDCIYDSSWSPWMYDCTLKTQASLRLKDGTVWTINDHHRYRLVFDDETTSEFWVWKHPAREQDSESVNLDSATPENYDLYTKLQQRLRDEVKTTLVTSVTIQ